MIIQISIKWILLALNIVTKFKLSSLMIALNTNI